MKIPQLVRYAILCAQQVTPESETRWHEWADRWLDGSDRRERVAFEAMAATNVEGAVERMTMEAAEEAGLAAAWAASLEEAEEWAEDAEGKEREWAEQEVEAQTTNVEEHVWAVEQVVLVEDPSLDLDAIAEQAVREEG